MVEGSLPVCHDLSQEQQKMTDDLSAETAQGVHVGDVVKRGGSVLQVKDQLKRLPRLQALFSSIGQLTSQRRAQSTSYGYTSISLEP